MAEQNRSLLNLWGGQLPVGQLALPVDGRLSAAQKAAIAEFRTQLTVMAGQAHKEEVARALTERSEKETGYAFARIMTELTALSENTANPVTRAYIQEFNSFLAQHSARTLTGILDVNAKALAQELARSLYPENAQEQRGLLARLFGG